MRVIGKEFGSILIDRSPSLLQEKFVVLAGSKVIWTFFLRKVEDNAVKRLRFTNSEYNKWNNQELVLQRGFMSEKKLLSSCINPMTDKSPKKQQLCLEMKHALHDPSRGLDAILQSRIKLFLKERIEKGLDVQKESVMSEFAEELWKEFSKNPSLS